MGSSTKKYHSENDEVYKPLQKHFDSLSVGYPSTKSGVEYKILREIYDPEDIHVMLALTDKDESLSQLFSRYQKLRNEKGGESFPQYSAEEMHEKFLEIKKNGGIRMYQVDPTDLEDGVEKESENLAEWRYSAPPFVVGILEYSLSRYSEDWVNIVDGYMHEKYAINYLSTDIPQMRVVPINQAVENKSGVVSHEKVREMIEKSSGPFIVGKCVCKYGKKLQGEPCSQTDRLELCMGTGPMGQIYLDNGWAREISKEEALEIQALNEKEGLIMQVENTQNPEFFCACCKCCCGPLHMGQGMPRSVDFLKNNYHAVIDVEKCVSCGLCEKSCAMDAIKPGKGGNPEINLKRCIGCGVCVAKCPKKAILLAKNDRLVTPPETRDDLYDQIRKNKRGTLAKYWRLLKAVLGFRVD